MENQLPEIEEEKGNLLLRLVDFDEHKDFNAAKEKIAADQKALDCDRFIFEMDQEALLEEKNNDSQTRSNLDEEIQQFEQERQQFETVKEKLAHDQEALSKELESFRIEQESARHEQEQLLALKFDLEDRENALKQQLEAS